MKICKYGVNPDKKAEIKCGVGRDFITNYINTTFNSLDGVDDEQKQAYLNAAFTQRAPHADTPRSRCDGERQFLQSKQGGLVGAADGCKGFFTHSGKAVAIPLHAHYALPPVTDGRVAGGAIRISFPVF